MRTRGGLLVASVLSGTVFGFTLSNLGFGDYDELNRMFTFQDRRMLYAFAGAVVVAAGLSALFLPRSGARGPFHVGIIPGAVLFGAGWAISGGCPAIPIVQVAGGYLPALASVAGVITGMRICRWLTSRYLPIDRGTCG